ncbi:hypothetical protein TrCOL_g6703 [Triparma columacea]|uniref:Uncharacterized protein n=1 Tax=Triparma columacea TaxID=722753 RepID=A0A9W7L1I4_9STRA|nr:hypothetical protein TrCOL_g6703 [Triparma columacea]
MKFLLLSLSLSLSVLSVSTFGDFKPDLSDGPVVCDATAPADYCDCEGDCGSPLCECPDAIACCDGVAGDGDMDTTPTYGGAGWAGLDCDANDCYNCEHNHPDTGCTAVGCMWSDLEAISNCNYFPDGN